MGRIHKAMRRAAGDGPDAPEQRTDTTDSALAEFGLDAGLDAGLDGGNGPDASAPDLPLAVEPRAAGPEATAPAEAPPEGVAPAARANGHQAQSIVDRIDAEISEKIVIDDRMLPESKEQYRRLAAALHRAQEANGIKAIMIASAAPGEGKTLTACNLALTLSESYQRRVLLIDADLRRPQLHRVFKVKSTVGLSEAIGGRTQGPLPLQPVSPRLTVLPAGTASVDPMAGLTSDSMRRVVDEAREVFDWIIIDTPPVGLMTDANLLAALVDGTVLVVKAGQTPYELVKRASDTLSEHGQVLGVVLNRVTELDARGGYGYGYKDYGRYYGKPGSTEG